MEDQRDSICRNRYKWKGEVLTGCKGGKVEDGESRRRLKTRFERGNDGLGVKTGMGWHWPNC